jgi:hypothetical protein
MRIRILLLPPAWGFGDFPHLFNHNTRSMLCIDGGWIINSAQSKVTTRTTIITTTTTTTTPNNTTITKSAWWLGEPAASMLQVRTSFSSIQVASLTHVLE